MTSRNSVGDIDIPIDIPLLSVLHFHQETSSNKNDLKIKMEVGTSSQDLALLDQELFNPFHF